MSAETTTSAPVLIDGAEVCRLASIGPTLFHAMRKSGLFGPRVIRIGAAVRFDASEVRAWLLAGCPAKNRWAFLRDTAGAGRQQFA
jgi:predicted DNA-binding transcriptional regulator AlpA